MRWDRDQKPGGMTKGLQDAFAKEDDRGDCNESTTAS